MSDRINQNPHALFSFRWKAGRFFFIASLFLLASAGWLRLAEVIDLWYVLYSIRIFPGPWYIAVTGGLSGFFFTCAALFCLLKLHFSSQFTRVSLAAYFFWFWADRVLFSTRADFFYKLPGGIFISLFLFLVFTMSYPISRTLQKDHNGPTNS